MSIDTLPYVPTKQPSHAADFVPAYRVLLDLLRSLDADRITYRLSRPRDEAVMVEAAVPGERWEIEVFEDGHVEFERFRSLGNIGDANELGKLIVEMR